MFNNKNLRMNQEIGYSSGHGGQKDAMEFSKTPHASIGKMNLKLIDLWNERVHFRETKYII
jgi:hypothetical protein